jgi:hypothetical protein
MTGSDEGPAVKAGGFVPTHEELRVLAREYLKEWYQYEIDWIVTSTWSKSDWKHQVHCTNRLKVFEGILGTTELTSVLAPVHEYYLARVREIAAEVNQEREAELQGASTGASQTALPGFGGGHAEGEDDYPF